MLVGRTRLSVSILSTLFCAPAALAQLPNTSERVNVTISRDGLFMEKQSSTQMPYGGIEAIGLTPQSLRWRLTSDGSWIAQAMSLGDHGALSFTQYGSFDNSTELYSAFDVDTPAPVWSDGLLQHNYSREVHSSDQGGVHIALHQEYSDSTQVWRRAVLRKYSSDSAGAPEWTYTSPVLTVNEDHSSSALSEDGQTIVLCAYNGSSLDTQVTIFDPASSTPVHDFAVPTFGQLAAYDLSADGSTLALASSHKIVVVDVSSATIIHEAFQVGHPQFGALALSGDGSLLAHGTLGEFSILERDAQSVYAQSYAHALAMPTYCRRIELSQDGSTLVAGLNVQNSAGDARIISFDVATEQVLFDLTLNGTGNDLNLFEAIECSQDGARFAVGLWGDSGGQVPQVLVFRREHFEPILADSLGGSVTALDFSSDGESLAVASKGTHAMQWGGGGSFSLYRVGATKVSVSGVPFSGAVVDLEHHLRVGTQSKMLVATSLASTPAEDLSFGSGLLYLDPTTMWELPVTVATAESLAVSQLALPSEAALVGTSLYVQGVNLDKGLVSRNWVQITILP